MADYIPNAENFEIDVILGNLDIDENIEIQNEFKNACFSLLQGEKSPS